MSEEQSPLIVNPTIEKPKRNWKRTLLILFILLFFVSLIGIGLYLLVPKLDEGSPSTTQEQATPSAKKAEHPLKNKIIYTKTIVIDSKKTPERIITNTDTDIYAMNMNGTGETKIYDFEPNEPGSQISLSPKDTYLSWVKDNLLNLKKLLDSNQNVVKSIGPIARIRAYKFSPDETKIAVLVGDDPPDNLTSEDTSASVQIYDLKTSKIISEFETVSGSGKSEERIGLGDNSIDWISNNQIISIGRNSGDEYLGLYFIKDGRLSKKLTYNNFWLNNSKNKIAFTKSVPSDEDFYKIQLWVSSINGDKSEKISEFGNWNINSLAFSPDDKKIALTANNAEATLFQLISLDTGKVIEKRNKAYFTTTWLSNSESFLVNNGIYVQNISLVGIDGEVEKDLTSATIESFTEPKSGKISNYRLVGVIQ